MGIFLLTQQARGELAWIYLLWHKPFCPHLPCSKSWQPRFKLTWVFYPAPISSPWSQKAICEAFLNGGTATVQERTAGLLGSAPFHQAW